MSRSSSPVDFLRRARSIPAVNRGLRLALGAPWWRHKLPPSIWRRVPVTGGFSVAAKPGVSFRYVAHGEPLGKTLFWRGIDAFEPGTSKVFGVLAERSRVLFDVGAYSGYYTLLGLALNPRLESVCFEPMPAIRAWLLQHLELNGFESRTQIVAAAVNAGGVSEASLFAAADPYSPSTSLHADYGTEQRSEQRVRATSIDDFIAQERPGVVDLIKIDTEGAEDEVLWGARECLKAQRPFVLCEILEANVAHLAKIEDVLRGADYQHAHIRPGQLVKQARVTPDPARKLRNFLLWPRERQLPGELELVEST